MKLKFLLSMSITITLIILAWLWFNGTIEKYWMRHAIEHGDQDRIRTLLQKGVDPNVY